MSPTSLLRVLRSSDAPTESESDRDGVLSYAAEWHALEIGLAVGFLAAVSGEWHLALLVATVALGVRKAQGKTLREVAREGWYALSGLFVGAIIGMVGKSVAGGALSV